MIEPASKKPAKRQALTPFILQLFLVLPLSPHLDLHWLTGPHIFSCGDQIYHIKNSSQNGYHLIYTAHAGVTYKIQEGNKDTAEHGNPPPKQYPCIGGTVYQSIRDTGSGVKYKIFHKKLRGCQSKIEYQDPYNQLRSLYQKSRYSQQYR